MAYKQAYSLVLEEKWAAAKTAMDELVRQFPKSAWVDDARFWSCYAMEKTGQSQETVFKCYQKFVDEHPESEWADDAKSNMIRLAQGLAKAGKPEYQTIIESYEDAAEDDIKLTALYALQNIGDEEALKTILGLYDKAEERQAQEPDRLHARGDGVARGLRQAPRHRPRENDEEVRRSALFAVGDKGGPEAVKLLKDILASKAPADIAPQRALRPGRDRRTPAWSPFFAQIALTDPDQEMARTAAFALQEIEGKEATEALRRILKEAKDPEIRQAALFSLIGPRGHRNPCPCSRRSSSTRPTRRWPGRPCSRSPRSRARSPWPSSKQVLATSKDEELRRTALMALGEHGGAEAKDALLKIALTSADDEMAEMAVFALSEMQGGRRDRRPPRPHEERQVRAGPPGRAHEPSRTRRAGRRSRSSSRS